MIPIDKLIVSPEDLTRALAICPESQPGDVDIVTYQHYPWQRFQKTALLDAGIKHILILCPWIDMIDENNE